MVVSRSPCARSCSLLATWTLLLVSGCSGEAHETGGPEECEETRQIGDGCAGLPHHPSCLDEEHVASCTSRATVSDDAGLASALASASAGACVELASGAYGEVIVPAGVAVLGPGADAVRVERAELSAGGASLLCGVEVGAGGVVVQGDGTLENVRVVGTSGDGVEVGEAASLRIVRSEVVDSVGCGVAAFAASGLHLEEVFVRGSQGPGVWVACSEDPEAPCACDELITVSALRVILRDNKLAGLLMGGTDLTLTDVEIADNTLDDHWQTGGGVSVQCTTIAATGLTVRDNTGFGLMLWDSSGVIGDVQRAGVLLDGNLRGVILRRGPDSPPGGIELAGCSVAHSAGIGVSIREGSGIVVRDSEIRDTELVGVPVIIDGVSVGSEDVGDGIAWAAGVQATLERVEVTGSARVGVLIDGEVGPDSVIHDAIAAHEDPWRGLVQQRLPPGGVQPTVSGRSSPLMTTSEALYPFLQ